MALLARLKALRFDLAQRLKTYQLIVKDPRTPRLAKLLLGLAVGYTLMPFDLIPDFIPVIGHIDDAIIVPILIILALKLVPKEVAEDCAKRAAQSASNRSMDGKENEIQRLLNEFASFPRLPDGRTDYSQADRAAVVTCFVKFAGRILLLKRSEKVRTYQKKWGTVAGYLDEPKPLLSQALRELNEELGISEREVKTAHFGTPYEFFDPSAQKSWLVFPLLLELNRDPVIKLDWEHTESQWILPEEIAGYDTVPNLAASLKSVL